MAKKAWILIIVLPVVLIVGGCSVQGGAREPEASPPEATETPAPSNTPEPTETPTPTDTPTPEPTSTPSPPTATPTPSHPVVLADDFSSETDIWYGCDICQVKNGRLHIGKYPPSGADMPHIAYCDPCGQPANYRMAVDAAYRDGVNQPGRGYGFLVKQTEEYIMLLEISTFQDVIFWKCEAGGCELLDGKFSGHVKVIPQGTPNRIEVEFQDTGPGTADIYVRINGSNVLVIWNQTSDPGYVGLQVYGHSLEIAFDNFEFEEYEPYGTD